MNVFVDCKLAVKSANCILSLCSNLRILFAKMICKQKLKIELKTCVENLKINLTNKDLHDNL